MKNRKNNKSNFHMTKQEFFFALKPVQKKYLKEATFCCKAFKNILENKLMVIV